jgi:hypothetical protein
MMSFRKYINFDRIAFVLFIVAIAGLIFSYGVAVVGLKIFPYRQITIVVRAAEGMLSRPHHLYPVRYSQVGTKTYDADAIAAGLTLLSSYWPETDWSPGLKLIDSEGNALHHWHVDAKKLYPQSPHKDRIAGKKNQKASYVHGSHLFPNGDVLFNVEYLGLFRMDACGEVVWKLPYRTHHSVFMDKEGNAWVPGLTWVEAGSALAAKFPGLATPFARETALKVSPDGQILLEVDLLDALYNSDFRYLFFHYRSSEPGDITHLNDIEVLSSEMSSHFPIFDPGDLLVSFRTLNVLAVLDQNGMIKWLFSGELVGQHDPDFEDSGMIVTFNNRSDGTEIGKILGGTEIIGISPADGSAKTLYPTGETDEPMYSIVGGKHQLLRNGNRLITEAGAGRVLEVTESGRLVWEWIHEPYSTEYVPEVLEASRYEYSVDQISMWPCHEPR